MKTIIEPRLLDAVARTVASPCLPEDKREALIASEKEAMKVYNQFRAFRWIAIFGAVVFSTLLIAMTIVAIISKSGGLYSFWLLEIITVVYCILAGVWNNRYRARIQNIEEELLRLTHKHKAESHPVPTYAIFCGPYVGSVTSMSLRILDAEEEPHSHASLSFTFVEAKEGDHLTISLKGKQALITHGVNGSAIYALDKKLNVETLWSAKSGTEVAPMAEEKKPEETEGKVEEVPSTPTAMKKATASQSRSGDEHDLHEKLKKLHALVEEGVIEEADYIARKAALIAKYLGE